MFDTHAESPPTCGCSTDKSDPDRWIVTICDKHLMTYAPATFPVSNPYAEIETLKDHLRFVERRANHHGTKPHMTAEQTLSVIQHYPAIKAITNGYVDGKAPDTFDPYAEIERLKGLINTPHTEDFFEAVRLEAAHQQERWGTDHDQGKEPTNWLWLLGHLASKSVVAFVKGDRDKGLHHIISSAAVLLNWHRNVTGEITAMRPGIDTPEGP